jgi:hypothetical protein
VIIKVGILLDSTAVPAWQRTIIADIKKHTSFSIDLIVLNDSSVNFSYSSRLVYKLLRRSDRALFSVQHDNFKISRIQDLLDGVETLKAKPIQVRYTDEIPAHEINVIKEKKLDLIIRFGFRILKGDILSTARYGVWSLHHGDSAINRGGPPGFWEVIQRESVTGVTLQILSNDLDGGMALGKAFSKTDFTSFNRNQNAVYWAGIELFCAKLKELSAKGPDQFFDDIRSEQKPLVFYNRPLYKDPKNLKAIRLFLSFILSRLFSFFKRLFVSQQWSIYYKLNTEDFERSMYRYLKLTPPKGADWADPFVIKKDEQFYLFYEELLSESEKAHISCLRFNSNGKLVEHTPRIVLKEDYHLSYPFIFDYEGKFYMIPEAASSKSVWLYRCENFPDRWVKFKALLVDAILYDPTIYFHNGYWFLLGTQKPYEGNSPHQYLYIYYTDDLLNGNWQPHQQNPVTRDVRGARPAGRIFKYKNMIIRPSQIGAPKYGYGIRFHEITKLSPTQFEERLLEDILPDWTEDLLATHTFNFVDGFSVIDAQVKRRRFSN